MPESTILDRASAGASEVPADWLPVSQIRALVLQDPVLVWLEHHGAQHGFSPDKSPYDFSDFLFRKGNEFEAKWMQELAAEAITVCQEAFEVRSRHKLEETLGIIQERVPVIVKPALWWAPERIYGVPDLIARTSWLREKFPGLAVEDGSDHYVVLDIKFTTNLDRSDKKLDLANYGGQVRLYSYMLGQLQGTMPEIALLVTRDRISDPLVVPIPCRSGDPLDPDLAAFRDQYLDIKLNGSTYVPWHDAVVAPNLGNARDEPWHAAKVTIARDNIPGGDPCLVCQVSPTVKEQLGARGFPTLQSLLDADPATIPLEDCRGLGPAKSKRIRMILQANKAGVPVRPPAAVVPPIRQHEFFVDFEYFTNVNVDFENQWPSLEGCEMVFMVGVGWEREGGWRYTSFAAGAESHDQEGKLFEEFLGFLNECTDGAVTDASTTALYHWTSAEVWQLRHVCDRHELVPDHPLRALPWVDSQRAFLNGPGAVPGMWDFGLKEVAKALGESDPRYQIAWPGELGSGLRAMVMGWRAYEADCPMETTEMNTLNEYLEADCKALWAILRWLRAGV